MWFTSCCIENSLTEPTWSALLFPVNTIIQAKLCYLWNLNKNQTVSDNSLELFSNYKKRTAFLYFHFSYFFCTELWQSILWSTLPFRNVISIFLFASWRNCLMWLKKKMCKMIKAIFCNHVHHYNSFNERNTQSYNIRYPIQHI